MRVKWKVYPPVKHIDIGGESLEIRKKELKDSVPVEYYGEVVQFVGVGNQIRVVLKMDANDVIPKLHLAEFPFNEIELLEETNDTQT